MFYFLIFKDHEYASYFKVKLRNINLTVCCISNSNVTLANFSNAGRFIQFFTALKLQVFALQIMDCKHTKQEFLRTEALQNAVVRRELIGFCHY